MQQIKDIFFDDDMESILSISKCNSLNGGYFEKNRVLYG